MKTCFLFLLLSLSGFGQSSVKPILLKVTFEKTTTLIFPFAIRQADRGMSGLLVQKSPGMENVLLVKAARANIPETNLTVFTSDGKLYPFLVRYAADPDDLNYSFADSVEGVIPNDARLKADANMAAREKHFMHRSVRDYRMLFQLEGIYQKDQFLWFSLSMLNRSVIDYKPAGWRCFVRNKIRAKRTAVQEIDKVPVFQSAIIPVAGGGSQIFILGFPVFMLGGSEELVIECTDTDGERVLSLTVGMRKLLRARNI